MVDKNPRVSGSEITDMACKVRIGAIKYADRS
jgi:hypothetical protein